MPDVQYPRRVNLSGYRRHNVMPLLTQPHPDSALNDHLLPKLFRRFRVEFPLPTAAFALLSRHAIVPGFQYCRVFLSMISSNTTISAPLYASKTSRNGWVPIDVVYCYVYIYKQDAEKGCKGSEQ